MENNKTRKTQTVLMAIIALGVWVMILQNTGIIPTNQNVKVVNTVDVDGAVKVSGQVDANIDNTVDINIKEIQGRSAGSRASYSINGEQYQSLDVSARY